VNTVVVATSARDAAAAEAVVQHHALMAGRLSALAEALLVAHDNEAAATARDELVHWAATELLPHARAEERALYPLAAEDPTGRLLVEAMTGEHEVIGALVEQLRAADTPTRAAGLGTALRVMFESHLAKENDLVLPLVAQRPGASLADALHGMHEQLDPHDSGDGHGASAHAATGAVTGAVTGQGHDCGCGEVDGPELPVLDARSVPHAIRHATIFGALDALRPGGGLVLVAPHDPLPLLRQVEQRSPGAFAVDYLERGPEAWRLRFLRATA
jgi:uncharacterized protein (DUF2249 family)/iron-sulfur cluster repair protein YtfE (RIC family)